MSDIENKKIMKFGYEDTDKKIEIDLYGLVFEIKNFDNIEKIKNTDTSNISNVEAQIEEILGEGAVEKINNKRILDGYKRMDLGIELNILGCIFEVYGKEMLGNVTSKVAGTLNDISEDMNNLGNNFNNNFINREQRRNYNKHNINRNRRNNRRY